MNKTQHYVQGQWLAGNGEGHHDFRFYHWRPFTSTTVEGLDVPPSYNTEEIKAQHFVK